jgi:hypothetical protein
MFLLILTGLAVSHRDYAQAAEGSQYFPETGHFVVNEFLEKYESVPNGREIFGLPITDAFESTITGTKVQYFEKVRFELDLSAPPDLRVGLTPLGQYSYEPGQILTVPPNSPACENYPQDGYPVCYAFLDFFLENGGVPQFGYPISSFEVHDGWIVQYFDYARFEWHPERPSGQRVVLTNLGNRYFLFQDEDPSLLRPNRFEAIPYKPTMEIKARAFVKQPIMPFRGVQTLYVIVQDQYFKPVENASITFEVKYSDKTKEFFQMQSTNSRGISTHSFLVTVKSPDIVEIIVTANFQSLQSQTKTSFQIWW